MSAEKPLGAVRGWTRRPRRPPEMRACASCGALFQLGGRGVSREKRYCSQRCANRATGAANAAIARAAPRRPKACRICGAEFTPLPHQSAQRYCPDCKPTVGQPGRGRIYRYGLTLAGWEALKARFDGLCWICRHAEATVVDHDHATGQVRGALCGGCNRALSWLEREGWLPKALAYLRAGPA
jgi:hypothetical protein